MHVNPKKLLAVTHPMLQLSPGPGKLIIFSKEIF